MEFDGRAGIFQTICRIPDSSIRHLASGIWHLAFFPSGSTQTNEKPDYASPPAVAQPLRGLPGGQANLALTPFFH
jgi:hypothetical protein